MTARRQPAKRRPSRRADGAVAVMVRAEGWRRAVRGAVALCRRAVAAALDEAGVARPGEIAVVLADDRLVRRLNRDWRGKDAATNVLAFPADTPDEAPGAAPVLLGDVVIALGTTRREARAEAKVLADHLAHLVVHGTLHLLGHDHQTDRPAARMEALEAAALARMGIANPYRDTHTKARPRR
jgi:probable rRNA maturation factor